ncbi:hypothetical protein MXB_3679 [Myxobolus squamalis]|nr:hypothetical protein MXB_3679 [Myxobolus squamalis]
MIDKRYKIQEQKKNSQRHEKSIQRIVSFELKLLKQYTNFIKLLVKLQKETPRAVSNFEQDENNSDFLIAKNLCDSLSRMLTSLSHFNYSETIYSLLVQSCVNLKNSKACEMLYKALENHFKNDETCESSLYITKLIVKFSKQGIYNFKLIDTFLCLNILDIKEIREKFITKETDQNLKVTQKNKSALLAEIFSLYFRGLKDSVSSATLSSCLKGIVKYSCLLNVDIYYETIKLAIRLLKNEIVTLFKFQSIVDSFEMDYTSLYEALYKIMFDVIYENNRNECIDCLIECISRLILNRKRDVGMRRCYSFSKRLISLCLHTNYAHTAKIIRLFTDIFTKFPSLSRLYDSQSNVGQKFLQNIEHPEHCCPEGIILWEHQLLNRHYDSSIDTNFIT